MFILVQKIFNSPGQKKEGASLEVFCQQIKLWKAAVPPCHIYKTHNAKIGFVNVSLKKLPSRFSKKDIYFCLVFVIMLIVL